ncbi:phage baseplate assembly protein [Klebsiella sp. WOUb02]|uniref:phage baseplate assembly protein n=1 Tax=Klebsiella sp. WOUb02 TaxID=3161071 RepID=UPI003CEF9C9B
MKPGQSCTVSIGSDRVMTGYIDDFIPSYDAENVSLRVMGRDKTGELVDGFVVDKSGQWKGLKLEQLAATISRATASRWLTRLTPATPLAASPSNRVKPALNCSTGWQNSS